MSENTEKQPSHVLRAKSDILKQTIWSKQQSETKDVQFTIMQKREWQQIFTSFQFFLYFLTETNTIVDWLIAEEIYSTDYFKAKVVVKLFQNESFLLKYFKRSK